MKMYDIILGNILYIAFNIGLRKVYIENHLTFLRFFIAGYIAIYYAADLKPYMHWLGEQEDITYQIAAFILCFLAVSIALWFLSKLLTRFVDFLALGVLNRLLGGTFIILKYALLLSFVLFAINIIDKNKTWIEEDTSENSYLYYPIASIAPTLIPMISDVIEDLTENDLEDSF